VKVAVVCPRPPERPNRGDVIRVRNFTLALARKHDVHLLCLTDGDAELEGAEIARTWCASVRSLNITARRRRCRAATALFTGRPLTFAFHDMRQLLPLWDELHASEPIDVVIGFNGCSASLAKRFAGPRVIDLIDVDSAKWSALAEGQASAFRAGLYRLEARRLRRSEPADAAGFDRVVVTSAYERDLLRAVTQCAPVDVVSTGVDVDHWTAPTGQVDRSGLVFVGGLDYEPNLLGLRRFVSSVLPRVRHQMPDVRLRIVGRNPAAAARMFRGVEGVDLIGAVDDPRPFVWSAGASVAPMTIAPGIQVKVLEAMAAATPVVATSLVARGLAVRNEEHIMIADDDRSMAESILLLLGAPDRAAHLARGARSYVEATHRVERCAQQFEDLVEAALAERGARCR
jgi:polysaccharide biosynthesis protein PslH